MKALSFGLNKVIEKEKTLDTKDENRANFVVLLDFNEQLWCHMNYDVSCVCLVFN